MMERYGAKAARLCGSQFFENRAGHPSSGWRNRIAILFLAVAEVAHASAHEDLAAQLQKATAFHQQADYAHSIPILKQIVQRSPRNYVANLMLGEDLLHSGNFQESLGPLEVACAAHPKDGTAEVYLTDAATAVGDFPVASEALQSGIARSGGSGPFLEAWASYCLERYRIVGQSLRTTKRGEAVALRVEAASHPEGTSTRESLLEESAVTDPEQPGIWGELGVAQLELRQQAKVQESLKAAQGREPQGAETLQLEALLAAVEQNWSEAEERLRSQGARSPTELRSTLALWPHPLVPGPEVTGTVWDCLRHPAASCPLTAGQPRGGEGLSAKDLYAQGRWEQLAALPVPVTTDASAWLWRGVGLAKMGNCVQAIAPLERGTKADPLVAGFWMEICYAREVEHTAARLRMEEDEAAYHQLRGDLLLRLQGDTAAALAQYAEALKLRPKDPPLLERLAEASMRVGDFSHAKSAAEAALAIDPHRQEALRTLAALAMNSRDYDQALPWLRQLTAESPGDPAVAVELGTALAQTGETAEALQWLAPALTAGYPDEKGALHALLGRELRKLGREAEAKKAEAEARRLSDAFQARNTNGVQERPDANQ